MYRIEFKYTDISNLDFRRDFNILSVENDLDIKFDNISEFISYFNMIQSVHNDELTLYGEHFYMEGKHLSIGNNEQIYTIILVYKEERNYMNSTLEKRINGGYNKQYNKQYTAKYYAV